MTFGSPACCSSTAGWTTCASFTTDDVRLLETIANHALGCRSTAATWSSGSGKTAAEQTHQAAHDHLTGLPNRRLFAAAVREALRSTAVETWSPSC